GSSLALEPRPGVGGKAMDVDHIDLGALMLSFSHSLNDVLRNNGLVPGLRCFGDETENIAVVHVFEIAGPIPFCREEQIGFTHVARDTSRHLYGRRYRKASRPSRSCQVESAHNQKGSRQHKSEI